MAELTADKNSAEAAAAREAEEFPLLKAVAKEQLVKTRQAGKRLKWVG
jgi:hypothetical protein